MTSEEIRELADMLTDEQWAAYWSLGEAGGPSFEHLKLLDSAGLLSHLERDGDTVLWGLNAGMSDDLDTHVRLLAAHCTGTRRFDLTPLGRAVLRELERQR